MKKSVYISASFLLLCAGSTLSADVSAKVSQDSLGYKVLAQQTGDRKVTKVKSIEALEGDLIKVTLPDDSSYEAHLAMVNAPEMKGNKPFAKEAKERLNSLLEEADTLNVEEPGGAEQKIDGKSTLFLWADDVLLQEALVTEGLARVDYIQSADEPYLKVMRESEDYAKQSSSKIWSQSGVFSNDPVRKDLSASQAQAPAAAPAQPSVFYKNCKEVKAAGAAPIRPGDPGWDPKFDRDGAGIGCER